MATDAPAKPGARRRLLGSLAVGAFIAITLGVSAWWRDKTYHFVEVLPNVLYRCGNQGSHEFGNALRMSHPKTIVPLVDDAEWADPKKPQFQDEQHVAWPYKARVDRVPVKLGGWPSTDDVRKFLAIAQDRNNQPVIVHCAQGVRRTGMMVAAYQMSVLGWDKAKTAAAIESFGHSDRTTADIRKFIEIYDPATRTVTTQPAQSQE